MIILNVFNFTLMVPYLNLGFNDQIFNWIQKTLKSNKKKDIKNI